MIDLLLGGSPCQGFSFAGSQLNFNDPRSKLFFDYVKAVNILNPKYFLLENVNMKKEYQDVISNLLGVKPIEINSALVSAQNRVRLYWTNIPNVTQPNDKGILLKDIIEDGYVDRQKSYCIDANYYKGSNTKNYLEKSRRQIVLTESADNVKEQMLLGKWRKLTPIECERLQTLPDGYTNGISNTQRYKALGNGWTRDIISHILSNITYKKMNTVISLFDGISCGQAALEHARIEYNRYYASEIDKYAITITQKNYPHTLQLGDITKINWNKFLNYNEIIQSTF